MGDVVSLSDRRFARGPAPVAAAAPRAHRTVFAFDLSSPFTYLAAERVDRLFAGVVWRPALEELLTPARVDAVAVGARAEALGLPLVWPATGPATIRPAMRIASLAAGRGVAAPYVLAASRLAYCGGYELDHPDVLAEAAAAAGLDLDEALRAAGDPSRDAPMEATARRLLAQGADRLPVMRVGRRIFAGEERLGEALAATQLPALRFG